MCFLFMPFGLLGLYPFKPYAGATIKTSIDPFPNVPRVFVAASIANEFQNANPPLLYMGVLKI